MNIVNICPDGFGSNCYLIENEGEAFIVDPSPSADAIIKALERDGCKPVGILLTHGHFDHIVSVDTLRKAFADKGISLPLMIHEADSEMLLDAKKSAFYTFFGMDRRYAPADVLLSDGDVLKLGDAALVVMSTPGHSPGSVCYICADENIIFTGDTIFAEGYGRYDLWGGSLSILVQSLRKLRELDGDLVIYPGHGDTARLSDALDNSAYIL